MGQADQGRSINLGKISGPLFACVEIVFVRGIKYFRGSQIISNILFLGVQIFRYFLTGGTNIARRVRNRAKYADGIEQLQRWYDTHTREHILMYKVIKKPTLDKNAV